MVPVLPPLHKTAVNELVAVNAVGCVMVCDVVAVQPLASVMVMVYEPEVRPLVDDQSSVPVYRLLLITFPNQFHE